MGIRPTIDGRYGGVRESLEEQTKRLAKAVAEFIENNVYLPNGEKVKVCITSNVYWCCCRGKNGR